MPLTPLITHVPLTDTGSFSLDVSGIAGFFGGEESFAAMSSVHLMRGRRWMGWYNSPGSYYVAKKYGTLAKSRLWNGLFPGPKEEPAAMLELDSKVGPRYMGVYSGTRMPTTGHLSYLLARYCDQLEPTRSPLPSSLESSKSFDVAGDAPASPKEGKEKGQRPAEKPKRSNITISIVELGDKFEQWKGYPTVPEKYFLPFDPFGLVATLFTIAGGLLAAFWADYFSCAMIFLGALSNGVSCYVLGSGVLEFVCPIPSDNSPRGDGILTSPRDIILLKGDERSVSNIIRGRYYLHYASAPKYKDIGLSSVALTLQFLLQLFLVPQGKLIGQVMFLVTFIVSWGFNAYLASVDRETLQTDVLLKILGEPKISKFEVDKWSTAAAYATFFLNPKDPENILNELIPNSTVAWNRWKSRVTYAIKHDCLPTADMYSTQEAESPLAGLDKSERDFVIEFLERADEAYKKIKEDSRPGSKIESTEKGGTTQVETRPVDSMGKNNRSFIGRYLLKNQSEVLPSYRSQAP